MCSIGGFISSKPLDPRTASLLCKGLLWYGRNRGSQSAGLYVNGKVVKAATNPGAFIESEAFDKAFDAPVALALTHTRQPTCGGTGDAQAQPFKVDSVVSVHNGWLHNLSRLKAHWNITKKSGVDSELVTRFVAQYGAARLPEFIKNSDGPSAIACVANGELYLIRDNNPIVYTSFSLTNGVDITAFASEHEQLLNALHYVWLMHSSASKTVKESQLVRVTPSKLEHIGKAFDRPRTYYYGLGEDYRCRAVDHTVPQPAPGAPMSEWDAYYDKKYGPSWNTPHHWDDGTRRTPFRGSLSGRPQGMSRSEWKAEKRRRRRMKNGGELFLGRDTRDETLA